MTDHYFTPAPDSAHNLRVHTVNALGLALSFETDAGVFSKDGLDEGSQLLLNALPPLAGRVLDLGCGWGALGVTLAKRYPQADFVLSDINERATALAAGNARRNGASNVAVCASDGFAQLDGAFDEIISNPPIRAGKRVIYPLFEASYRRLRAGGRLFLVIRKQQGAESAAKFLATLGFSVERIARDKGFWVLCAKKTEEDFHEAD